MSTGTQTCEIVLPGYTLTERIGTGGYAEVWRAEAPGGIEKAVKIVYGYYDDEFAAQELKALERIKGVRHPFLLSLERFEIISGRLAILTELADMSLDQRLRVCRGEGLVGIPRDELLQYMADAAEALDFLAQRHGLLHLDIKPENLLVLGDHIKVADFGLVKEIATRTQNSLVSGMTPTYAAPEIFDDDPSTQSDQYSLAIVYQEMLVGALPFPGRTAAQLAKQHTQAEPQLATLPAEDRAVVARALAKKPHERFESCKAFVDALRGGGVAVVAPVAAPRTLSREPATILPPAAADTSPASIHLTQRAPSLESIVEPCGIQVTQPIRRAADDAPAPAHEHQEAAAIFGPEQTIDVDVPVVAEEFRLPQATLYIAAGGVGIQALCRLLGECRARDDWEQTSELIECVAIDTDRDELRQACSRNLASPLELSDTLHVPLKLPQDYDNSREILDWVSRRWLYNIPRSLSTRGYRPLGRVALVDHARQVTELVEQKLTRLASAAAVRQASGRECDGTVKVVLLASTGGGTGSGMIVDLGNLVKCLADERQLTVEVHACLVCTCLSGKNSSPLLAANTYALLTELNHATAYGNHGSCKKAPFAARLERDRPPVDFVYCVPTHSPKPGGAKSDALESVASYLAADWEEQCRATLRACRANPTDRELARGNRELELRKLGHASLDRVISRQAGVPFEEESLSVAPVDPATAASLAIECANITLLSCGADRRTLLVVSQSEERSAEVETLCRLRPQAAVVAAGGGGMAVLVEESAISVRSVAAGLSRMYPGVAEAAHRLHTRIDIEWQDLLSPRATTPPVPCVV